MQRFSHWGKAILLPVWVTVGFGLSQVVFLALLYTLKQLGFTLKTVDPAVFNTVAAASVYMLTLAFVVGLPWWVKQKRVSKEELGLTRLISWADIGLAPTGFIIYFLFSALLVYGMGLLFPHVDLQQVQETGFQNMSHYYEYLLAFITLVVLAPLAEEVLFRGYLFGKLKKIIPPWVAIIITSLLFGAVHGQLNVAIDVFALSVVLCILREITGSIWAGILLHMLKNSLAFYVLFINPALLHTMGR